MKRAGNTPYPIPKKPKTIVVDCDVSMQPDGYMTIHRPFCDDIRVNLPVLQLTQLDRPELFYADALDTCRLFVPKIPNITAAFVGQLSLFKHAQTMEMLEAFSFCREHLLYNRYEADNPGHLFIAMQIFGGWWGGVARESFLVALRNECCAIDAATADDLVLSILAYICKCFGAAARTPLMPHLPEGAPPTPVSALVDYLVGMFPMLTRYREDIYKKIRDWHVPQFARDDKGVYRTTWASCNQIDRINCLMQHQLKRK
jgi:hypothetical protein